MTEQAVSEISDVSCVRPKVVYLVLREALSSVFSSQVLNPMRVLGQHCSLRLVTHVPIGHIVRPAYRSKLNAVKEETRQANIHADWLTSPPARLRHLWSDTSMLRRYFKMTFRPDEPFIVHCRNAGVTTIAIDAIRHHRRAKVIYDIRGDEVVETAIPLGVSDYSEQSPHPAVAASAKSQRRAATEADAIIAVSKEMLVMLEERYHSSLPSNKLVIPCCPDVDMFRKSVGKRDEIRSKLGLEDSFIVSYLGSLAQYQVPDQFLRVFKIIKRNLPNAHFLAITTQPEAMQKEIARAGISIHDTSIKSVPAREVPKLLSASDVGLLLREPDAINRVASPIKFGEYLAAGVPVITSVGIGDYSSAVSENRIGCVVDNRWADKELGEQLKHWLQKYIESSQSIRQQCTEFANAKLRRNSYIPQQIAMYCNLVEDNHVN